MVTTDEVVSSIENYVNSFTCDLDEAVKKLGYMHPTLQQTYTKLCLKWLRHLATTDYYDGRNEASVKFARSIKDQLDHAVIPLV